MNQFDNEVSSTLKEIAERVETPPYLKDRIDKELLRRCPEYRKKIAVIFGGCSPEYSVSLQSAYAVISHMDTEVYTPVLIGISQSGDWFLYEGDIEKIVSDTWCGGKDCTPVVVSPNRTSHNLLLLENGKVKKLHGLIHYPEFPSNYARIGIALYGMLSSRQDEENCSIPLFPVLSVKARVSSVRDLYKGEGAGYGLRYVAKENRQIAVLSITYKLKLNGGDMKSVQGDSGHAQLKMVADVYSHIIDEDRRLNAKRFEDAFYSGHKTEDELDGLHARSIEQAAAPQPAEPETDQQLLLKLLNNPEMAALLKTLAKSL